MTSVLFLIQDVDMPSSRVRVLNLLPQLREAGLKAEVTPYPKRAAEKLRLVRKCRRHDIVYLQKKTLTPIEASILRAASRILVYDFDDAIYYRHEAKGEPHSRAREMKFRAVSSRANLVVAGNRILADYAKRYNDRIEIIPSAVETKDVPQQAHTGRGESCVIGWVGGKVNLPQLRLLEPVLEKLSTEHDIELRILSNEGVTMESVKTTHVPWRLEKQNEEVARFDIGVMPLPDSLHARGKCCYKALQYMAAGVPVVASDIGINREVIGEGGIVVESIDDFYDALARLIENPDLRRATGRKGQLRAAKDFSIEAIGQHLAETLLKLERARAL